MSQPNPYNPTTDFSAEEAAGVGGRSTVRTAAVDTEFANIATVIAQIRNNLALVQRDDGHLLDGTVDTYNLTAAVLLLIGSNGFNLRGAWLTTTAYAVKDMVRNGTGTYVCNTGHTSGTFATDLAAGKWTTIFDSASYTAAGVSFAPTGVISATNVQAAITQIIPSTAMLPVTQAASLAAGRTQMGLGTGDSPTFTGMTLTNSASDNQLNINSGLGYSSNIYLFDPNLTGYQIANSTSGGLQFLSYLASVSTARMRLDRSGNLGLAVTPSAWGTNWVAIDMNGAAGAVLSGGTAGASLAANVYNDNTNWRYKGGAAGSLYAQAAGVHTWYTAVAGIAGNIATLTPGMTFGPGLQLGAPTGGDKGAGTLNAAAGFYLNGTALPNQTKSNIADQVITSAAALTLAHGLSALPQRIDAFLVCQTNEAGYTAGQIVPTPIGALITTGTGLSVIPDATNLVVRFGSPAAAFVAAHATTGVPTALTNASWKLRLIASA